MIQQINYGSWKSLIQLLRFIFSEPDLFKGYTVNIRAALWSKNPTYIISGGEDKAMR